MMAHVNQFKLAEDEIIDYDEMKTDFVQSQKKYICSINKQTANAKSVFFYFNPDVEKRTLNVQVNGIQAFSYQLTADRVSLFFACSPPDVIIRLMA